MGRLEAPSRALGSMTELTARNKRNLGLALVAFLGLWFFWSVREVLNPLLLAYLLAFIVHPFVLKLEAKGWSRMKAVNAIYVFATVCGLLLVIGFWSQGSRLIGKVVRQAQGEEAGGLFTNLDERFGAFVEQHREKSWMQWLVEEDVIEEEEIPGEGANGGPSETASGEPQEPPTNPPASEEPDAPSEHPSTGDGSDSLAGSQGEDGETAQDGTADGSEEGSDAGSDAGTAGSTHEPDGVHLLPTLQRFWNEVVLEMDVAHAGSAARRSLRWVSSWFGSFLGLISMLVLLPIYTWFLLFELERIHRFIRRHLPREGRQRYTRVGAKIGDVLTNFLRGQLVVCLLKGLTITVGLFLAGVPYALFLGLTAGFMALIPFFGAFLAAVFAFLVGLLSMDFVPLLWRLVLVFGIAELMEGYVYVPRIIGGTLGLHPLAVLVAVLVGGAAMGMFGFLIALPLVASLVILAKEFLMPALREWADEGKECEGGSGPEQPRSLA